MQQDKYYYDTEELLWFPDYVALNIPDINISNISKEFFKSYKKNFIQSIEHNYFQRKIVINTLLL
ncbi:MAG: hypothetical protein GXP45_01955 [bacterium]|nr:hypothetical protein [bacterium]